MIQVSIDGTEYEAAAGDRLIDVINGARVPLSQVCYHPQLGPIQTCDTSILNVNGKLMPFERRRSTGF
jgi:formate dehydrogenase major subunit